MCPFVCRLLCFDLFLLMFALCVRMDLLLICYFNLFYCRINRYDMSHDANVCPIKKCCCFCVLVLIFLRERRLLTSHYMNETCGSYRLVEIIINFITTLLKNSAKKKPKMQRLSKCIVHSNSFRHNHQYYTNNTILL